MILLDTHIWIWWVHGAGRLSEEQRELIAAHESDEIGVCTISCWEVAKLVERGRLELPCALSEWLEKALGYPGVRLLQLTPAIAVESTRLPGEFHRDPADQIIVATARLNDWLLVTSDRKIVAYPYVRSPERPSPWDSRSPSGGRPVLAVFLAAKPTMGLGLRHAG
jgi:PIN domain nuclease of toxin-antitoxin system